jgi:tetratricopeptide (TPR) repeat protein
VDEGPVRNAALGAVARSGAGRPGGSSARLAGKPRLPADVESELEGVVGSRRARQFGDQLASARRAFGRERYDEARRVLARLVKDAPDAPSVRELYGLTLYRLERWKQAAVELEAFLALTGSPDQLPVLADCYRALGRYDRVEELWTELKEASPSGPLVAEGRIVAAGAKADQGDLRGAIDLLERSATTPKRVRDHHLRLWYALADLYDRAGDTPRARALFQRIRDVDPNFADVGTRLGSLGR